MNTDNIREIRSYEDLELEKERLKYSIALSEEKISNHFKSIAGVFTIEYITNKIETTLMDGAIRIIKIIKWIYNLFSHEEAEEDEKE
jgi:hypothetical protein